MDDYFFINFSIWCVLLSINFIIDYFELAGGSWSEFVWELAGLRQIRIALLLQVGFLGGSIGVEVYRFVRLLLAAGASVLGDYSRKQVVVYSRLLALVA